MKTLEKLKCESLYYYDSHTGDIIGSRGSHFYARIAGKHSEFFIPKPNYLRPFFPFRIIRRALRLDMANAVLLPDKSAIIVIYLGNIFRYEIASSRLIHCLKMRQCRNVLYQGIAINSKGIYLGEYGANATRSGVPVWHSSDGGRTWKIIYEFAAGKIRHIHGIYNDPFTDNLWLTTGDVENECYLVCASKDFTQVTFYGDGSQKWRAVSLIFEKDKILWGMDSPLEIPHLQEFDRATGTLRQLAPFPGPIWYTKTLEDGYTLLQTSVEVGPAVHSRSALIFASRDNRNWQKVAEFQKDRWPMCFFKYGVISFADGKQTSKDFVLFGEALKGVDGVSFRAALEDS